MEENQEEKTTTASKTQKKDNPLVFISHDTRDAQIAEAFSKLLKSVSAGMLKSFRSSDNKGTQGIEFGLEWYPKIIESLQESSDVICILTELSINRPWLLFEAGMAKGKLNTPILGIAVGIPLNSLNTGPFAQFQNCDDDTESLTKLVKQLVAKIPDSEPDEDVIRQQVDIFQIKFQDIIKRRQEQNAQEVEGDVVDNNSSAKLFEEVKLMFKELPLRIENASQRNIKNDMRKLHPGMIEELLHHSSSRNISAKATLQMILSPTKNDFPWIYEHGVNLIENLEKVKNLSKSKHFHEFNELIEFTFNSPFYRESFFDKYEYRYIRELPYLIENYLENLSYRKKEIEGIEGL